MAHLGKVQRNPSTGKISRDPATGKLKMSTDTDSGCCCACVGCAGKSAAAFHCALAGITVTSGCTAISFGAVSVHITQSSLSGTFTITRKGTTGLDACIWEYVEHPGTTVAADFYGTTTCTGTPLALDFVITLQRSGSEFYLLAYLGQGDLINVLLFDGMSATDNCYDDQNFNNQCTPGVHPTAPCLGVDGTAAITPIP